MFLQTGNWCTKRWIDQLTNQECATGVLATLAENNADIQAASAEVPEKDTAGSERAATAKDVAGAAAAATSGASSTP